MLKPWRFAVLERERERLGITQGELAAAAGKTVGWYSLVQKWKREPLWTDIMAMAARVGVNLDCLVGLNCKAGPVTIEMVQQARELIGPRKKRGGVARRAKREGADGLDKVAEKAAGYRPGRKR